MSTPTKMASVPLPGAVAVAGETLPRVCAFTEAAIIPPPEGIESGFDYFTRATDRTPDAQALGWRKPKKGETPAGPYEYVKYGEARDIAVKVGTALVGELGLERGGKVGIYGKNCPSWQLVEQAVSSQGLVLVPVYDSLGPNALEYICNHAELAIVFVSAENLPKMLEAWPECTALKKIVVFHPLDPREDIPAGSIPPSAKEGVIPWKAVLDMGVADVAKTAPGKMDELFVIMYTSGTTGDPKGVMLLNRAMIYTCNAVEAYSKENNVPWGPGDAMFSYLPLAHIFAQQFEIYFLGVGARIDYYQGDLKELLSDLEASKPTLFIGVPRVYARFEERIKEKVLAGSFLKKAIFNYALGTQLNNVKLGRGRNGIFDAVVFNKIKAQLLPNCRCAITGAAPMSADTNDFLKTVLNTPVVQGYGLTESVGGMVCTALDGSSGHCGGLIPVGEIKLKDVPDMNYLSTDVPNPRGEVMLKGENVTIGYYKNEKATAEALNSDGYFATGDIGQWLPDGSLQIIDRKKNLFKLSQGEYVSPEHLEQEYVKCRLLSQIWVYGNSFENALVAVCVPDLVNHKTWAEENGHKDKTMAEVAALPDFKEAVFKQLNEMKVIAKFKGYEAIKDIYFDTEVNDLGQAFTVENNCLTPTFKAKRPQLLARYKAEVDAMYEKMKK